MRISPQTTHDPDAPGETVPILETEHLSKVFPVRRLNPFAPALGVHAVEDASLALYPGRVTALVGESGSGKTTIARLLARVYDPTAGTIRFQGQPIPLKGGDAGCVDPPGYPEFAVAPQGGRAPGPLVHHP